LQQRTFFQNECGGKHKKHAYVKTKCYIAIVKFGFSKKIFRFPMMLKKYSDFGGGKKFNLIQSFCHIT
jgi:hypothetical protein